VIAAVVEDERRVDSELDRGRVGPRDRLNLDPTQIGDRGGRRIPEAASRRPWKDGEVARLV
jgi:hypothetical protein